MIASEDLSDNLQLVVFSAGEDEFGLEIAQVHEIIRMLPITRIPRAAECVEGVINLRGNVVPVINLHQRLGLKPRTDTEKTRIIVAQVGEVTMGIVVDGWPR
jgi:purine-binding chemotaxis protein CheW